VLQQLDSLYGSARVIGLAIHAGPANFTSVSPDYPRDFTTDDGDDLASFFGVWGLPLGMVNRLDFASSTHLKTYSSWAALTATELALAPEVLFNAYSGFVIKQESSSKLPGKNQGLVPPEKRSPW
jgi:hypothetical protein